MQDHTTNQLSPLKLYPLYSNTQPKRKRRSHKEDFGNLPLRLCECGCGQRVKKPTNRFLHGHTNKRAPIGPPEERFWKLVAIGAPDECWLWIGSRDGDYGRFYTGNTHQRAHRFAYKLTKGEISKGNEVCHECDTPLCCNPVHLFDGTHQDNMTNMVSKGRLKGLRGERANRAKLNAQQVLEIRRLYETGNHSHLELAHKFGMSEAGIRLIIIRKTWTHI